MNVQVTKRKKLCKLGLNAPVHRLEQQQQQQKNNNNKFRHERAPE
jgi:hypothetical protein